MNPLDGAWDWAGDKIPAINRAGTSDEATHWNHSLVCALVAGLGAAGALVFHAPPLVWARLAWAVCWALYVVREVKQHGRGRWGWDGVMDVAVPLCWGVLGLAGDQAQLVRWLNVSLVLGVGYTLARPAR